MEGRKREVERREEAEGKCAGVFIGRGRLFTEVERVKGRSKFPNSWRYGLETGREREGGTAQVPRVAKRCFYYIHKQ